MPAPLILAALLVTQTAVAEEELTISPDRPGFADGTGVVAPGHVQLELGARGDFDHHVTDVGAPSLLLRIGLTNLLEVRVVAPDVQIEIPHGEPRARVSSGDASVGVKVGGTLVGPLSMSAVPFLSLPTGSDGGPARGIDGGVGLNFQLNATDAFAIGWNLNLGFTSLPDRDGRAFDLAAGIALGYQLTEAFGAFVESYLQYTDGGEKLISAAGGLTYLVTRKIQLDLSGGGGLNGEEKEPPYLIAGVAVLL